MIYGKVCLSVLLGSKKQINIKDLKCIQILHYLSVIESLGLFNCLSGFEKKNN